MALVADLKSGRYKLDLDELCRQLLSTKEYKDLCMKVPCLNRIGSTSQTVADMGDARVKQLALIGDSLIKGVSRICKAGTPDEKGVLDLLVRMTWSRMRCKSSSPPLRRDVSAELTHKMRPCVAIIIYDYFNQVYYQHMVS